MICHENLFCGYKNDYQKQQFWYLRKKRTPVIYDTFFYALINLQVGPKAGI